MDYETCTKCLCDVNSTNEQGLCDLCARGVRCDHLRPAFTIEGTYEDGYGRKELDKPYWTAECHHTDHGPVVLNSGHHWTDKNQAEAEVLYHLTTEHEGSVRF